MSMTKEARFDGSPPRKKLSLSPMHTRRYFKCLLSSAESERLIEFLYSNEESLVNHNLEKDVWMYLTNLRTLKLSGSMLSTLPEALSILQRLEDLNLSKNIFFSVPKVVLDIKSLRTLSLSENLITKLPSLNLLEHLETLNVSHNKLTDLPCSLANMNSLKTLDLSFNRFKKIPECLQKGARYLEHLDVSSNVRLNLNSAVKSHNLRRFIAKDISYSFAFPKWLFSGKISVFEEVNLSRTKFEKMFLSVGKRKTMIKKLILENCHINNEQLQKIMRNVVGLRYLSIGNQDFLREKSNSIDQTAFQMLMHPDELLELKMRGTNLSFMPQEIKNFRNLTKIDVGNNHLSWLTEEFCALKMLEELVIDNNTLVNLPEAIGELENLREFRAAGNALTRLPESFKLLKRLKILDLYDNQFTEVLQDIEAYEELEQFDFEMNYASSEGYKKIPYEHLKQMIRFGKGNCRVDGAKIETPKHQDSPRSEKIDSNWEFSNDLPIINEVSATEPENWDVSEDSSDEFDPYNPPNPRVKVKFNYLSNLKRRFCPNDIHPLPMLERIAIARAMGYYEPFPAPVEGQFSDAEEN